MICGSFNNLFLITHNLNATILKHFNSILLVNSLSLHYYCFKQSVLLNIYPDIQIFNIILVNFSFIISGLWKITSFHYEKHNLEFFFSVKAYCKKMLFWCQKKVFIWPSFLKWYLHWTYNSRLTASFSSNQVIFLHSFANHCCYWYWLSLKNQLPM